MKTGRKPPGVHPKIIVWEEEGGGLTVRVYIIYI
jgi:hypothetical protein